MDKEWCSVLGGIIVGLELGEEFQSLELEDMQLVQDERAAKEERERFDVI